VKKKRPRLSDYGKRAYLVVLDGEGQAIKTAKKEHIVQYAELGSIDGDPDASIGVRYEDRRGNDVAVSLTPREAREWL
jgi:hypothetical protein